MKKKHAAYERRGRWIAVTAVVAAVVLSQGVGVLADRQFEAAREEQQAAGQAAEEQQSLETTAQAPAISADAAILVDAGDGTVLYEHNADKKMYPASTTKIMTALVVLELCEELNLTLKNEVVVPREAEGVEGSSLYLKAGEQLTLEELMYGLMLQSGNDGAVALAACMGGTVQNFVEMMNEKAGELGCTGTHFVNPNGLSDEEHYTTARDLAVIAREAMKHEAFRQIVAAEKWSGTADSENAAGSSEPARSFANKNKTVFQYDGGDGIKIGYTKASGRTLVASASRGGNQVIAVVLNDGNWFNDAYRLMDFGFQLLGVEDAGPAGEQKEVES